MLALQLPPEDTFLYLALKTAISFIAGYADVDLIVEGMSCQLVVSDDARLADGFRQFFESLKAGAYGIEPWIPIADRRDRLGSLAKVLDFDVKAASVEAILNGYLNYIEAKAREGELLRELSKALGVFMEEGYLVDAELARVPMLNRLSPEYMEALRVFGGVGFSAVPRQLGFRRLMLGLHSTCLGLMGLWASYAYSDGTVEYYVFPSRESVKHRVASSLLKSITEGFSKVMSSLKRRPFTNINVLALIVALSTAGTPPVARRYTLVTAMRGGRRVELVEGFVPLSLDRLYLFADILDELSRDAGTGTSEKLRRVAERALTKAYGSVVANAALKICQTLVQAINGVVAPHQAIHLLARYSYAQENLEIARGISLTTTDADLILEALRRVAARH